MDDKKVIFKAVNTSEESHLSDFEEDIDTFIDILNFNTATSMHRIVLFKRFVAEHIENGNIKYE